MKVLVIGGAGMVGQILQPGLEAEHELFCFDRRSVPALGKRSIVGDLSDQDAVETAVQDMEAVVYLAMGMIGTDRNTCQLVDPAFDVNVRDAYRVMHSALAAGARRIVYASSLSVYRSLTSSARFDEQVPADAWDPYGLSKRVGEMICRAAAQHFPDATIVALRMINPCNEETFAADRGRNGQQTGPNDLRNLYLAALRCDTPGAHVVQATGDVADDLLPNHAVNKLLGWRPKGE